MGRMLVLAAVGAVLLSACNMSVKMSGDEPAPKAALALSVQGNPTSVNVTEGSTLVIVPTLSATSTSDIHVTVNMTSTRGDVPTAFSSSFPVTTTIPAGSQSGQINIQSVANPAYTGDLPFTLSVSSPELSGTMNIIVNVIDQQPLTLGSFAVSGILDSAESSDTTVDAVLSNSTTPEVRWSASAFATSYDVTVLADDGTTTVCPTQNVTTTQYAFSSGTCQLLVGSYYKAQVVSKALSYTLPAALYRFQVTSTTQLNPDSIMVLAGASSVTFDPRANDVDPSATITGVSTPTAGSASFTSSSVTYTPPAASGSGVQTFTYTVNSGGNIITGVVTAKVMTQYTWTGAVSSAWATTGNWCGSVTTPGLAGVCAGGAAPTSSKDAVLDLTCSSSSCNPVIASGAAIALKGLKISGHTLTQTGSATLTIGTDGYVQTGGSFVGGTGNITVNSGVFTLSGGTFTATSGTIATDIGAVTIASGATFNHNNGTFQFGSSWSSTQNISTSTARFYNVVMEHSGDDSHLAITGNLIVDGDLTLGVSSVSSSLTGNVQLKGNLVSNGYGYQGTGTIELVGNSVGQTVSSPNNSRIPGLKINTGTYSVTFGSDFKLDYGSLNVVSVGTFSAAGTTLSLGGDSCPTYAVAPGNVTYNNVSFTADCFDVSFGGGTFNIAGNLVISNASIQNSFTSGTLLVGGNVDVSGSYGTVGSASIKVAGNSLGQMLTGGANSEVPNLEIAAGANNVTMSGLWTVWSSYKVTSVGTLTPPTTLSLDGGCLGYGANTFAASLGSTHYNGLTFTGGCPTFDLAGATAYVDGLLTFGGNTANAINNATLVAGGDLSVAAPYTGTAHVRVVGNNSGQTITTQVSGASVPNLEIAAGSDAVTFSGSNALSVQHNYTYTSSGTFTQNSALQFGIGDCSNDVTVAMGTATYGNIIVEPYCKDIHFTSSANIGGNLTVNQNQPGSLYMPNPGTGYHFNVGGTYSNAGVAFHMYGATNNLGL